MTRKSFCLFVVISLFATLLGCQNAVTISGSNALTGKQSCQTIPFLDVKFETVGITWFDITVGQSTQEDVIAQFGAPDRVISTNNLAPIRGICRMIYGNGSEFWISNKQVVAINLSAFGFRSMPGIAIPKTTQELYERYGKPDFVVWHGLYHLPGSRYAVWPTKGVMAHLKIGTDDVSSIVYFPPMTQAEYLASDLSQFISFEKRERSLTDMLDEEPRDPFTWGNDSSSIDSKSQDIASEFLERFSEKKNL